MKYNKMYIYIYIIHIIFTNSYLLYLAHYLI